MKSVYMPPPFRQEGADFARMKRAAEIIIAKYRLLFWIIGMLLFASKGGWMMYSTPALGAIFGGMVFMFLSAVCAFMTICEIIDLVDDHLGG